MNLGGFLDLSIDKVDQILAYYEMNASGDLQSKLKYLAGQLSIRFI